MRVIDSHIHFPEDRIIDDGKERSASSGTGYTSGRVPSPGAKAGDVAALPRGKPEEWARF